MPPTLPGGYGRSTFASVGPWSPSVVRGEGCHVVDEDGRQLIDFNNNFTSLIHGNAHPGVTAAASAAARHGASFGVPHASEGRHADALLSRIPGADLVRYANSGTEAVMLAVRVARAFTKRSRVVFVRTAYHGTSDTALVAGGAQSQRGVPRPTIDDVVLTPINDLEALSEAIAGPAEPPAAIVLDLMPNRAGLVAVTPEFAAEAARLCRDCGALLVLDEVITFRLGYGGLGDAAGVRPDLWTLGKTIGGGFPVGAVVGRAEVMDELNPRRPDGLEHGGTFTANPVTMEAGRVTLELFDARAVERLNGLGDRARADLAARIGPLGWEVRGRGSLLRPFCTGATPVQQRQLHSELWWEAYGRDVLLTQNGLASLSTPMTEPLVDDAMERLGAAIAAVTERHADAIGVA